MHVKIVHIVGARPQFVKLAPVSRAIIKYNNEHNDKIDSAVIHTGQHYDDNMSKIFFDELMIPQANYNLDVGSASHAQQTASMMTGIEQATNELSPDMIITYGDTNSTLAGALVASKQNIITAHVEAGLRSFNRGMPEEVNRIAVDHISDVLFAPTESAMNNLKQENLSSCSHLVGDVMLDAVLDLKSRIKTNLNFDDIYNVLPKQYCLATIHRAANTEVNQLNKIINIFSELGRKFYPVLFPVHPRTLAIIKKHSLAANINEDYLKIIDPVSYFSMLNLLQQACIVLTDSGGLQKEAFFMSTPCITLRDETEWSETVEAGENILAGVNKEAVFSAMDQFVSMSKSKNQLSRKVAEDYYGDGAAAIKIVEQIASSFY